LYELGYCKYFNLPAAFVDIGIPTVLGAIVAILGVLGVIHMFAETSFSVVSALSRPVKAIILRIGLIIALMGGYAMVCRTTIKKFITSLFVVPLLFSHFIFPLLTQRGTNGYLAKLEAQHQIDFQADSLVDIAEKKIGRRWFILLFFLYLLSFISDYFNIY
jgi:hypothetical protein